MRQAEITRWMWMRRGAAWKIPNGITAPAPARTAAEVRAELCLPDEPGMRVIAQISGITPHKRQMVLLEAARRVLEEDPRAFFLIIGYCRGNKDYLAQLEDLALKLGIVHRVRIAEYPGPIGDVWQLVDIHVHASLFDSLPNAILEGMALGKPAVVTSVGGIAEAVENGETGLVVPPGDPNALADGLLRLLLNPDDADAMGRAAQMRHKQRYHPAAMAQALEDCFESVLKPAQRGRT